MARKRRLRAKNRMGVVVPYDIAADDVTMGNGNSAESDIAGIKQAIRTLHASLGNYAFPGGKPDINLDGGGGGGSDTQSAEIAYSLGQKVTAQGAGNLINMYDELTVQLGTNDNLYVIDPSTVRVTMGNVEQQNVYDEETDTIHIPVVTGDVEIEANAMTYVDDGHLVAMFDGMNVDSNNNQWVDQMDNSRILQLSNCTINGNNVQFDGANSTCHAASTNKGIDVLGLNGTVESVMSNLGLSATGKYSYPLINIKYETGHRMILMLMRTNAGGTDRIIAGFRQANDATEGNSNTFTKAWNLGTSELSGIVCLSVSDDFGYLNNSQISRDQYPIAHVPSSTTELGIQCWYSQTANDYRKYPGNMYCVRVYSKKLSRAEITHNYKVDKKRFNLQ